jgi:hypothetical protein
VESVPEYSDSLDVTRSLYVEDTGVWYPLNLTSLSPSTTYYVKAVQYSRFDKYGTGVVDLHRAESQVIEFTTLP